MKILFITDNFPPEVNAPATRTYEHCDQWVQHGTEVTVLTCAPNFPLGKTYKGYRNKLYQTQKMGDIKVVRVWSYMSPNQGKIRRVLDYVSFSFMAFWTGLFEDYDVIIATSPQFFTTWTAIALSKVKRKPWIFELRDLWPDSIKTVGAMNDGFALSILQKIEMGLYRDASKVVAVTDAFKRVLVNRGVDADKIKVVTNGANLTLYGGREKDLELIRRHALQNKFIVGYIGTHGMAHDLRFIMRAIGKIQDPEIHFLFIGDGSDKHQVVALAQKLNLKNITFLPIIPKEKVPSYLSIIDVALVPLKKSDTFRTVIPSKIFEAAAMQKPILLGVEGQAQEIIERYDAGLCFEPENEEEFLIKLKQIRDPERYRALQEGCEKLARAYDRNWLAKKMLGIIQQVVDEK
jgi:glycosyltransferase involved in cell wall biosynthesis